jgi:phosphoribosylformylglycinamidine cyclo-ligase
VRAGCALIGGETAEHPGTMQPDDYDLAGFSVGIVDKEKIIDQSAMVPGDVILALPSSGIHSNGYSLVRKVFDVEHADLKAPVAELDGRSLGEALLEPTKIYVKPVLALLEEVSVKGISHITGGGFYENIPRSIPDGLGARIEKDRIRVLPIFRLIAEKGGISERDMFNTYNMGVGMSVVVPAAEADKALQILRDQGVDAYLIGEIIESEDKITIV